jgi:hypothetical protein
VAAVLAAGATQAQLGTAFLRCTESGAHPLYKAALADPRFTSTAITRAFSGRRARSLVNDFVRAHEGAPAAYPEVNNATRPLRAAASAGDVQRMSLYAGEGFRRRRNAPPPRSSNARLGTRVRPGLVVWSGHSVVDRGYHGRRGDVDSFEFTPPAFDRVTGYLHHLTEAGQGWINLLPGVDADEDERQTTPPGLFSLFSNRQPPVTMATLVPPGRPGGPPRGHRRPAAPDRRQGRGPVGRGRCRHARRTGGCARTTPGVGWSCWPPHGAPEADIIGWAIRAGTALCRKEMTGEWQAVVYLP